MASPTVQLTDSETYQKLRNIIAVVASIDPADITPTQNVWEDLQISPEVVLPKIVKRINEEFSDEESDIIVSLRSAEVADQVETVADLVDLIDNEVELG